MTMTDKTKLQPLTALVDALLIEGVTWEKLEKRIGAESKKRGLKDYQKPADFKRHIRYRTKVNGWEIESTEIGVRVLNRPAPKPKAEVKAKPAKKTGKATGRKVAKVTTEEGRQTVEAIVGSIADAEKAA
jgi:hypothetical protein